MKSVVILSAAKRSVVILSAAKRSVVILSAAKRSVVILSAAKDLRSRSCLRNHPLSISERGPRGEASRGKGTTIY